MQEDNLLTLQLLVFERDVTESFGYLITANAQLASRLSAVRIIGVENPSGNKPLDTNCFVRPGVSLRNVQQ